MGNDHYGDCAIVAVTVVINVSAGAGRVKLIYYCGEIGFCPPVQRATPLRGVGPLRRGVRGASNSSNWNGLCQWPMVVLVAMMVANA